MKKLFSRKLIAFLIVIGLATVMLCLEMITGSQYSYMMLGAYTIYQTGKTVERGMS